MTLTQDTTILTFHVLEQNILTLRKATEQPAVAETRRVHRARDAGGGACNAPAPC